ncbi:MAG TPA: hypothetical protein VFE51_31075 [Verrucomicrobiae bacterium]|nr:hypothetical protein [Verrucomicrobiae bacterium]
MESSADNRPMAWLPLTPRGVAAFAYASVGRVLLFQLVASILIAAAVVWVLSARWFPAIASGIEHLPERGAIRSGRLEWPANSPQTLSENRFLAFAVDLEHSGQARSASQIQVEFGRTDVRICSVFGCAEIPYPYTVRISFNLSEVKPWWGAWAPMLLALSAAAVTAGLLLSWAALATIYCLPAWLVGLYLNRELTLGGSWRLAAAALMPGGLVMTVAIAGYGLARLDLVRLAAAWGFHILLGWTYLFWAAVVTPKIRSELPAKENPFRAPPVGASEEPVQDPKNSARNPFSTRP